jgi:hypothetical protein
MILDIMELDRFLLRYVVICLVFVNAFPPLKKNPSYIKVDGFAELCLSCGVEDIFG